jgi:hypothetical protein
MKPSEFGQWVLLALAVVLAGFVAVFGENARQERIAEKVEQRLARALDACACDGGR